MGVLKRSFAERYAALKASIDNGRWALRARLSGRWLLPAIVAGLSVAASACEVVAPEDVEFGAQDVGLTEVTAHVGSLDRSLATYVDDIEGTWLVYSEISTCVAIIAVEEMLQHSVYIVETRQPEPPRIDEVFTACDIRLSPILSLESIITDALLATSYPVQVEDGLVAGSSAASGYTSGAFVELWGLDMADPLREPFPTEADDPRIVDSDRDDHPAATLPVGGGVCDTYLIQRSITRMQGSFVAPDEIAGSLFSTTQQFRIDATQALCRSGYDTRSNFDRSRFRRIRIDGRGGSIDLDLDGDGAITCDEVLPAVSELVRYTPADHEVCRSLAE